VEDDEIFQPLGTICLFITRNLGSISDGKSNTEKTGITIRGMNFITNGMNGIQFTKSLTNCKNWVAITNGWVVASGGMVQKFRNQNMIKNNSSINPSVVNPEIFGYFHYGGYDEAMA